MTRQAAAVPDTVRWFLFQLQHPGWRFRTPLSDDSGDGRWHATNGTIALTAGTLAALLDQLDWIHTTWPRGCTGRGRRRGGKPAPPRQGEQGVRVGPELGRIGAGSRLPVGSYPHPKMAASADD